MVVHFGGVKQGVSELLQAVYTKSLNICCGFAAVLNFGFSNLGERGPYGGGPSWCQMGRQ